MTYSKPEVVQLDDAVKVIQGGMPKWIEMFPDSQNPQVLNATIGAYESDE